MRTFSLVMVGVLAAAPAPAQWRHARCQRARFAPGYCAQAACVYSQSYVPDVQVAVESEVAVYETYQYLYPGADARFIPLVEIEVYQNPLAVMPAGAPRTAQLPAAQPQTAPPPVAFPTPQVVVPVPAQPPTPALAPGSVPYRRNPHRRY